LGIEGYVAQISKDSFTQLKNHTSHSPAETTLSLGPSGAQNVEPKYHYESL